MLRFSKRLFVVNLLGTLFYLSCLLQWMWSILPFMPGIITLVESFQAPIDPATVEPTVQIVGSQPSALAILIAIIATVFILAICVYLVAKIPTAIGKTGQKITKGASSYIVPIVSHRKELTPKKRRQLTARVIVYLKIALATAPVILGLCTAFIATELPYTVIAFVVGALGVASFTVLGLQLLMTKLLKVSPEKTW